MPTLEVTANGTRELLESLSFAAYKDAKAHRRSLSSWLNALSPSEPSDDRAGVDTFTRLMAAADIVTRSVPEDGIYADTYEKFMAHPQGRVLFPEWAWRQYRKVQQPKTRALTSLDSVVGTAMRPYVDDATLRTDELRPAVPIAEVIASSRGIDSNAFRAIYLTDPPAGSKRFVRVGETAEIPKVTISVGEHVIDMFKYGRGVELSYEVMRRESLDRLAQIVQLMAVQNEVDKLATIIDVMVNGDGNAGTAATNYNLTTLDPATTANNPTVTGWISFIDQWDNPYSMNTALAQKASALKIELLNTGTANLPVSLLPAGLLGTIRPINSQTPISIGMGRTADAPASKIVGFDRNWAVDRVFEIGADLQETEKWVSRQTEAFFMSEVEGYMVRTQKAIKILTLST